jgi:hypothetical protein
MGLRLGGLRMRSKRVLRSIAAGRAWADCCSPRSPCPPTTLSPSPPWSLQTAASCVRDALTGKNLPDAYYYPLVSLGVWGSHRERGTQGVVTRCWQLVWLFGGGSKAAGGPGRG